MSKFPPQSFHWHSPRPAFFALCQKTVAPYPFTLKELGTPSRHIFVPFLIDRFGLGRRNRARSAPIGIRIQIETDRRSIVCNGLSCPYHNTLYREFDAMITARERVDYSVATNDDLPSRPARRSVMPTQGRCPVFFQPHILSSTNSRVL